jgi:hypothetical protein
VLKASFFSALAYPRLCILFCEVAHAQQTKSKLFSAFAYPRLSKLAKKVSKLAKSYETGILGLQVSRNFRTFVATITTSF